MNQLLAIGGGLAFLALARPEARKLLGQTPSEGATAAMAALPGTIAGVDVTATDAKDGQAGWFHAGSPIDTYVKQRRAFVGKRGAMSDTFVDVLQDVLTAALSNLGPYPSSMTVSELREFCDAWLFAYQAGARASDNAAVDFSLAAFDTIAGGIPFGGQLGASVSDEFYAAARDGGAPQLGGGAGAVGVALGDDPDAWPLTTLGRAVCALLVHRRRYLAPVMGSLVSDGDVNAGLIRTTFDLVWKLASELEGVAFTLPGARPSEAYAATHDYSGAAAAAAKASGDAVKNIAGDAAGAFVRSVLSSPIFWVALAGAAVVVVGVKAL